MLIVNNEKTGMHNVNTAPRGVAYVTDALNLLQWRIQERGLGRPRRAEKIWGGGGWTSAATPLSQGPDDRPPLLFQRPGSATVLYRAGYTNDLEECGRVRVRRRPKCNKRP